MKLTPEEWVRQHFASYLVSEFSLVKSRLLLEHQINYNGRIKRPDISYLDEQGNVLLLVECKAPQVKLTEEVVFQALTYSSVLNPKYIALSNGIQHFYAQNDAETNKMQYINRLPF